MHLAIVNKQQLCSKKVAGVHDKLECGPMPNVMASLPNIGGALCESSVIPCLVRRRKVWLTPAAGLQCIRSLWVLLLYLEAR